MKRQTQFIAQQAARLDHSAARIFSLTRLMIIVSLSVSLGLLAVSPLLSDRLAAVQLADGLFHAAFRIAAVGAAAGFASDIVVKRRER